MSLRILNKKQQHTENGSSPADPDEAYIEELKRQAKQHREGRKKSPYKIDPLAPYKGVIPRFFLINRHVIGLLLGGLLAFRNSLPRDRKRGLRSFWLRFFSLLVTPFVKKDLRNQEFPVQLRRRLEMLGPTYIKLGQVLSLREDILPKIITEELKNLLDRLPEVPFEVMEELIRYNLSEPLEQVFTYIDPDALGSASIGQTHVAGLFNGEKVVIKVVKPGIRDTILTDINLLKMLGYFLELIIPQYQPNRLIEEFCSFTAKEVDLVNEADNADTFAVNFADFPDVVFPKIYREYSNENMLVMELLEGFKPGDSRMEYLTDTNRQKLIYNGAAGIIRMLFKDGFFHADLHPGNLFILPEGKVGFIDLGMVGRFEEKTRRQMLYYFHALVSGDIEGAARYLSAMASVGKGGSLQAFRRGVSDLLRRFFQQTKSGRFSMGKLIVESLGIGARHRVFFPVEMTLMVKALITFESVGQMLDPKMDVTEVSEGHVARIFEEQFSVKALTRELMRGAPEFIDMAVRLPKIFADGMRQLDYNLNNPRNENPLEGLKSAIITGSCIVGGVIAIVMNGPIILWLLLFGVGFLFYLFGK
ncbi:MAG: AarF/ABC1/UbiB kinase family protein [Candidatus Cyclonatronum sp.]|uniref:ABC1 kinase family protein n=1 Tax=Cyclonatronum sp. TaxID=3024185 RepID=UPI0025BAFBD3|nr:AarF/UbiB family protein [Cyclonatronum sp.]MCC5934079.1 AarF/ABC1/UbiB kinase family protein [Balneolales bacterium]MCH8485453.1 AarF/ABC1/UbiB kinase family protein [Cyclonatronum sp.]